MRNYPEIKDTPPTRNDGFDWFFVGFAAGMVTIIVVLFVVRLFAN